MKSPRSALEHVERSSFKAPSEDEIDELLVLNFLRLRGGASPGDRNDLDALRSPSSGDAIFPYRQPGAPRISTTFAARSQRWWHDGSGADSNAKLAARGQLQRCREAC